MGGTSKWALKLGMAGLVLWGAGCVPIADYRQLETRYGETEGYVLEHKNDMREMERREKVLQLRAREQERQLALLRTRLQKSERLRQRLQSQRTVAASAPRPEPVAAPIPQEAPRFMGLEVNAKTGGLVLESGVMFGAGSATLKKEGKTILRRLASELQAPKYSGSKVRIEGHTDATPIKRSGHKSNWDLSGKRAMAVLKELEKIGISSDRLCFAGYASHQPIDSGQSKKALARNRRVEIVLAE